MQKASIFETIEQRFHLKMDLSPITKDHSSFNPRFIAKTIILDLDEGFSVTKMNHEHTKFSTIDCCIYSTKCTKILS